MLTNKIILLCLSLTLSQFCLATSSPEMFSHAADEYNVNFKALIKTDFKNISQVESFSSYQKQQFEDYTVKPTAKFIFGPLTNRSIGGEQKDSKFTVLWSQAYIENNIVLIPYEYNGQWLVNKNVNPKVSLELPLPYNSRILNTPKWKKCTDSAPEHQTSDFFWYFWDPTRYGCDHQLGKEFQMISVKFLNKTVQTTKSYPEYDHMIHDKKISMTFGFGYIEDPADPEPFKDSDNGMDEFRSFLAIVKTNLQDYNFKESEILEKEYLGSNKPDRRIGSRFEFEKQGLAYEIKVVTSGSIDQMELFSKSFSHDHDSFFGWFGHSRVGNGFDAYQFNSLVKQNKEFYSITADYQMIYWAGCNSYSYYTKPFFDFKANLISNDVTGTKSLDIISNGLPSFFTLNAANAEVLLKAIVNIEQRMTYQDIVTRIEKQSHSSGIFVLANILGDEDNN
ncbi:MAG: hypothetical protein WA160_03950 [Pseudobdellovibrio sp.]